MQVDQKSVDRGPIVRNGLQGFRRIQRTFSTEPAPVHRSAVILGAIVSVALVASPAGALEISGSITACHDPSRVVWSGTKAYLYSTAPKINVRASTDLVTWQWEAGVLAGVPAWMTAIDSAADNVWAPDLIQTTGTSPQYLQFYSRNLLSGASEHSVLGVATAASPAGPWTDKGMVKDVVVSQAYYRVIDPAPIYDQQGQLWVAAGSFGYADGNGLNNGGIHIYKVDAATGMLVTTGDNGTRIAGSWIEAPFLYFHDGYYYLFFNQAVCCAGLNSTYYIRMGRATAITGPYTDLDGASLLTPTSGGSLFMGLDFPSNYTGSDTSPTAKDNKGNIGRELGPGHVAVSPGPDGIERVTYHFYDTATTNGEPTLGLKTILWGLDGWPRPGWVLPSGTYAIVDAGNSTAASATVLDGGQGTLTTWSNAATQYWNVTRVEANTYTFDVEGKALATVGGGNTVQLEALSAGKTSQRWFVEQANDGGFVLRNLGTSTYLESTGAGAPVTATLAAGQPKQHWFITPVGSVRLQSNHSKLYATAASSQSGAAITLQKQASVDLQYFWIVPTADGYSNLVNAQSRLVLAVQGGGKTDGTATVVEADDGSDRQRFSLDLLTDGSRRIVPKVSGKALEAKAAGTSAGTVVQQGRFLHTLNQQWTLEAVTGAIPLPSTTPNLDAGVPATGGATGAGGATGSGGSVGTGGARTTGAGGVLASGGALGTGGITTTGMGAGGVLASGGALGTGGITTTGMGAGGVLASGGGPAASGGNGSGGLGGLGGKGAVGGAPSGGGTTTSASSSGCGCVLGAPKPRASWLSVTCLCGLALLRGCSPSRRTASRSRSPTPPTSTSRPSHRRR
jgi:arabinan endo-1,5-alpha-L-arabinosidase